MQYIQQPQAIEAKSFDIISEIIAETRPDYRFASPLHEAIIKRVIHTTADFDWLDILWFSPDALIALSEALSRPCTLYTDTTMALSGINKTLLARFGGECRCYISDPRVVREAQSRGMTRSMAAVDIAVQEPGEKVFVFGNAPTALFRLLEHPEDRGEQIAAMNLTMERLGRGGEAPGLRAARSVLNFLSSAPRPR